LRSQAIEDLSADDVKVMLMQRGFFDRFLHKAGKGIPHLYDSNTHKGLVTDHSTGLMWQQSSVSPKFLCFAQLEEYVNEMNQKQFAGFSDWRLPTLEEVMSLMECKRKNGDFYINPIFEHKNPWTWTADMSSTSSHCWIADFFNGRCGELHVQSPGCVRLVR